jgi:hypothetical protein
LIPCEPDDQVVELLRDALVAGATPEAEASAVPHVVDRGGGQESGFVVESVAVEIDPEAQKLEHTFLHGSIRQ